MKPFRFWRDPLCVLGCGAYSLNRWLLKPHFRWPFLHSYFNDLWLIPCALPLLLWLHRHFDLRSDTPPTFLEVTGHLLVWSIFFEWLGPWLLPSSIGDGYDVAAYAIGGLIAWLWWNRNWIFDRGQGHSR